MIWRWDPESHLGGWIMNDYERLVIPRVTWRVGPRSNIERVLHVIQRVEHVHIF